MQLGKIKIKGISILVEKNKNLFENYFREKYNLFLDEYNYFQLIPNGIKYGIHYTYKGMNNTKSVLKLDM